MKAVVAAFNQEKVLVGAFSVITNLRMELFEALLVLPIKWRDHGDIRYKSPLLPIKRWCDRNHPRHRGPRHVSAEQWEVRSESGALMRIMRLMVRRNDQAVVLIFPRHRSPVPWWELILQSPNFSPASIFIFTSVCFQTSQTFSRLSFEKNIFAYTDLKLHFLFLSSVDLIGSHALKVGPNISRLVKVVTSAVSQVSAPHLKL